MCLAHLGKLCAARDLLVDDMATANVQSAARLVQAHLA